MSTGFKLTPKPKPVDPSDVAAFGAAAETRQVWEGVKATAAPKSGFDDHDDKRRIPAFVMRFTAKEAAMLKVIAETTPHSMHEFCLQAVRKALDNHFK